MTVPTAKSECAMHEGVEHTRKRKLYSPDTDIYETSDTAIVVADIPGVPSEGIDITLEKNAVTIRGTISDPVPEGCQLGYTEYETGDYQCRFSISDEIDGEKIQAALSNGVLTLTLPKASPNRKKITVHAN